MTHLLHVDTSNVEEFMSKLSESRSSSVSKRPSVIRTKPKTPENTRTSEGIEASQNAKMQPRSVSTPPERPVTTPPERPAPSITKVSSAQNLAFASDDIAAGMETDSAFSGPQQRVPARPKQRPVSSINANLNDIHLSNKLTERKAVSFKERPRAPPRPVTRNTSKKGSIEPPQLPPRRPPLTEPPLSKPLLPTPSREEKQFDLKADDMYASIDDTAKVEVKPRVFESLDFISRPPLPARNRSGLLQMDQTVVAGSVESLQENYFKSYAVDKDVKSFEEMLPELPPRSELPITEAETAAATAHPGITADSLPENNTEFQGGLATSSSADEISSILENPESDASAMYATVNKPCKPKSPISSRVDDELSSEAFTEVPLNEETGPPLPPRTDQAQVKKAPPLPPRPSV